MGPKGNSTRVEKVPRQGGRVKEVEWDQENSEEKLVKKKKNRKSFGRSRSPSGGKKVPKNHMNPKCEEGPTGEPQVGGPRHKEKILGGGNRKSLPKRAGGTSSGLKKKKRKGAEGGSNRA